MTSNLSSIICPWREEFRKKEAALIERWKAGGVFNDSYLEEINCYWFQFEPATIISHLLLGLLLFLVFAIGTVTNALVVYIMSTSKHLLRSPVNIIILNLDISDFLMLFKLPVFIYNSMVQGPTLGKIGCKIYGFFGGFTGCASIMFLAAIALERYLLINRYKGNSSKPPVAWYYATVVCIWIYSGVMPSLPLFGIGNYVPEGYLTTCSFDYLSEDTTTRTFIFIFFIVAWLIPVSVIIGSYSAVICFVRKNRHESENVSRAVAIISGSSIVGQQQQEFVEAPQELDDIQAEEQQENRATISGNLRKRRMKYEIIIAKITASLVILWMFSWTPYAIVALIGISGYQHLLTPGVTMLPALFAKLSASINPFVYSLNHPKIWREIVRRFRCFTVYISRSNNDNNAAAAAVTTNNSHRNNQDSTGNIRGHRNAGGIPLVQFASRQRVNNRIDFSSSSEVTSMTRHYPSQQQQISSSFTGFSEPEFHRMAHSLTESRKFLSLSNGQSEAVVVMADVTTVHSLDAQFKRIHKSTNKNRLRRSGNRHSARRVSPCVSTVI